MSDDRDLARRLLASDLLDASDLTEEVGVDLPGKYELVRCLGRGGSGTVHLARDKTLDRDVAIKILHESHVGLLERFRREARPGASP